MNFIMELWDILLYLALAGSLMVVVLNKN